MAAQMFNLSNVNVSYDQTIQTGAFLWWEKWGHVGEVGSDLNI